MKTNSKTMHDSYTKALNWARKNICPKSAEGGFFDPVTGDIFCWKTEDFKEARGMIFISYKSFKYRGTVAEYISVLEQIINDQPPKPEPSEVERIVIELAKEFSDQSSVSRYSPTALKLVELAKGLS